MNKSKICLVLLSIALIITVASNVFLYTELETKNAEINSKNAELEAKIAELNGKNTEVETKSAELEAKDAEIAAKNAELEAKNSEIEAKDAEIAELKAPKIVWDVAYTDVREELALPGYHIVVTGTITNYGLTDVYNLQLQVTAYYVTGVLAINTTEQPGASVEIPDLPAGTTYEFNRWIYYEPGLLDEVTITPIWDYEP